MSQLPRADFLLQQAGLRVNDWRSLPVPLLVLAVVGGLYLTTFVTRFLNVLVQVYLLSGRSIDSFKSKRGDTNTWAVVTGATDGIGREFALQLAKKGYNIFLASRSPEKLGVVAGEIEAASPGIKTKYHAIDFGVVDLDAADALQKALAPLDIGILVNNVGRSHDTAVYFHETTEQEMEAIIQINVSSTLMVTRFVLPGMVERKRGLVLNVGSFAGAFPTPLLATYSGSKAFLAAWSQAIAEEVRDKRVHVELLNAFYVVSKLSKFRKPTAMIPTPKQFVGTALRSIGNQGGAQGRSYTNTPWPLHALYDWVVSNIVPNSIMLSQSKKMQVAVKRRADRKKAQAAKAK